ncbi:MAG: hypothetical protein OEL20_05190 [Sulfuritalea sp.]|nr:hypothetical protein [Sulfuritalea sp.]
MNQRQEITGAELTAPAALKVTLRSLGNPDHGQDPSRPLYGVRNKTAKADSMAKASALCRAYIEENDLGAGNWAGGAVTDATGKLVATVCYNGRVWRA